MKSCVSHIWGILCSKATTFADLKIQVLTLACVLTFLTCLLLLPVRIFHLNVEKIEVSIIFMIVSALGLYLIHIKRPFFAYLLMATAYVIYPTYNYEIGAISIEFYVILMAFCTISFPFIRIIRKFIWIEYLIPMGLIIMAFNDGYNDRIDTLAMIIGFNALFYLIYIFIVNLEKALNLEYKKSQQLNEYLEKKNKEIQMFSNVMAHDIKAPLRSINGFSQLIERKLQTLDISDNDITGHFSYIRSSVVSLEKLLEDLMIQFKVDQNIPVYESINIEEIIHQQLQKLKFQIEQSDTEVILNNLGFVYADTNDMIVLFNNLISNALKYQPKDDSHQPQIKITQVEDESSSIVTITDNGIGIQAAYLEEIFEPFKRLHSASKYEGTGLGLSICKSIMQKLEGSLHITSEYGKGTSIQLSFPKKEAD